MTLRAQIKRLRQKLINVCESDDEAVFEARIIMSALLSCDFTSLLLMMDDEIPDDISAKAESIAAERLSHSPLYYCLGRAPFCGREFIVNDSVLIPRPETEELAEKATYYIKNRNARKALDLCTGSGCIAVTLKLECPSADVFASDLSAAAIDTAKRNAEALGAEIAFIKSDLFGSIAESDFELIVSNPPYIDTKSCNELSEDVKREPTLALDGGADGLDIYRRIAEGISGKLAEGGALLLEIGYDQGKTVPKLFDGMFDSASVIKDISGNDRIVMLCGFKPDKGEILSGR
ncbi:MAG: peptide chain release factor N(5)-glutamine methyltransferase [Eubacteriales bacterium]|nr:peptide chain release factor N(5)-glutamine methyltransferase [Eubacteriales bacterium]MDD3882077.1 peptide chain release factor N(5)-glutamine methyltransferase [Eubacteriales bacterium]MDD4512524.1 peptide chain release factor N(5)-glutamine methyltransferase [Eubacteriales bacterium]